MQLYEAQVDNEIRQTQEYAVINNILRSQYKVDPKSVNGYAQAFAKALLKDQGYQDLKSNKKFKQVNDTLNAYVKKRMDAISAKKGQAQPSPKEVQENSAGNNNVEQPESQNEIKAVNSFNTSFLDLFDETSEIFQSVSNEKNPIQSISISDDGNISYGWADTKQTESSIEIPSFLKRYLEAEEIAEKTKAAQPDQPAPNEKKDLNSFFKEDWKNTLESQGLKVYSIIKKNNGNIVFNTNRGDISKKEILEEVKSNNSSMYDFDLTDKDVLNIQKEILRSIDLNKFATAISKKSTIQGLPYNLKVTLGGVLKESKIMESIYRIKKYEAAVNSNAKPKKFLVNFEATLISNKEKTTEETAKSSGLKVTKDTGEGNEESKAKKPEKNKSEEPKVSNFSEVSDESIVSFISGLKELLLKEIKKYHSNGGLSFSKEKIISQDRSTLGKVVTGEDNKKTTYTVPMTLSGGENTDYKFEKSDNKLTGSFSLSVTLGDVSKKKDSARTLKGVGNLMNQVANATLSTNNSYVKL